MSEHLTDVRRRAIQDPREREAIALLAQAGWTHSELAMTFMISESSVRRLLEAEGIGDE
jgi:DNA-directed RNA polymerase specialized sigma24 family protein